MAESIIERLESLERDMRPGPRCQKCGRPPEMLFDPAEDGRLQCMCSAPAGERLDRGIKIQIGVIGAEL